MKRHPPSSPTTGGGVLAGSDKGKLWEREEELPGNYSTGGGMDELLAVLGYRVRSADMADVAEKMERLEVAMGTVPPEESVAGFSADTVHYNPSDLPNWVQSMLSELNHQHPIDDQPQLFPGSLSPDTRRQNQGSGAIYGDRYDLSAIPGDAVYCKEEPGYSDVGGGRSKRMRASIKQELCESSSPSSVDPPGGGWEMGGARPVVVVVNDSQDAGVCLVHALLACAEAVQQDDLKLADAIVKQIGVLASSQAGAMGKVATYFAEALARRIYGIFPPKSPSLGGSAAVPCSTYADMLELHFYDSCPYLKFAHFTANQAILETLAGAERIHVVDLGLKQGLQWPALMQALALRPGGPPVFRLTGIVPPQQKTDGGGGGGVGWKLEQVAVAVGLKFEFREVPMSSLADLEPSVLGIRAAAAETLVVNAVFELHRVLATAGAAEKVLGAVRGMSPRLVTMAEQEANHNAAAFQDRFTEALHYYSTMFDSMEGSGAAGGTVMSEMYLGRQICEVVACEGAERGERHEPLQRWRRRMGAAGFEPVRLGSNAFKQASMLVALFAGGDGYTVEERDACLTLGWHTRPLIATSAWQPR